MKALRKLAALALAALAPVLASAATPPPGADLTVLAGRGQRFTLALDGRPLTGEAIRQLHVGWLPPGRHLADVQVYSPYGAPLAFRTTIWLQPGVESRYALAAGPYGVTLQPLGAGPSYGGYAAPGGPAYGPPPAPYGNAPGGSYGAPYGGAPVPSPAPPAYPPAAPGGGYGATPGGYSPAPGAYDSASPQPGYGAAPDTYLAPLSPADLSQLTQELRQQPTDDARLEAAQQALAGSSLQASELASLLYQMATEPGRVQLILLAHEHLADPANLSLVYRQLRPASVAEVQRALGPQQAY